MVGASAESQTVSVHWIDTQHRGTRVVARSGAMGEEGTINVLGSGLNPSRPGWGQRIIIKSALDRQEITMFNIDPDE